MFRSSRSSRLTYQLTLTCIHDKIISNNHPPNLVMLNRRCESPTPSFILTS
uniref:Uncharacterized protein n=1 Tax=Arundo donax TaxID=35708 RepID=A0A0A9E0S6_ARUDO